MRELESFREYDKHFAVYPVENRQAKLKGFIAIHRNFRPKPSFGATRMAFYRSERDALKDALRLSRLMSYKSIMAGLPYGGAKAVLIRPRNLTPEKKKVILEAYCEKVNELNGKFVTGADVGIDDHDLRIMYKHSPYMVGLKSQPVPYTALGIFYSLQVALREVFGTDQVSGRSFAIQGLGKIGSGFLKHIYKDAGKIYVADISHAALRKIRKQYPRVIPIQPKYIAHQEVDVFSPCAMGGAINKTNIKGLKCKAIVGGANNQLECDAMGERLFKMGILYAPDYIVNGGGLISVTDEYENPEFDAQRLERKIKRIAKTLKEVFEQSKRTGRPTNLIANKMAEDIVKQKYEQQLAVARV